MTARSATVAVIGAGDFIGAAIARKFAAEGYTVFVGRRTAEKLEPLKREIEAAGGKCEARALDARKEAEVTAFLQAKRTAHAPLEVVHRQYRRQRELPDPRYDRARVLRKVWEMACKAGFLAGREAARIMLKHGQGCDLLHGRDSKHTRRLRLRRVRQRQGRPADAGASHGARARPAEHSRCASGDRFRRRHGSWVRDRIAQAARARSVAGQSRSGPTC
jgi:NAD(P)-dependent dehydrogenase (short-subunit alcohol dehydrogenase family)